MSVYKRDLFKLFLGHFNIVYNDDELLEKNYQIFIEQVHQALQSDQRRFHLVETKGNTGVNAKKRFTHLRKKSAITGPSSSGGIGYANLSNI